MTEVYYPTIDSPQIRDLQFLVTDGESFFHDERRNFVGDIDCISEAALGFEVVNRAKQGRYTIYGNDRVFAYIRSGKEPHEEIEAKLKALEVGDALWLRWTFGESGLREKGNPEGSMSTIFEATPRSSRNADAIA